MSFEKFRKNFFYPIPRKKNPNYLENIIKNKSDEESINNDSEEEQFFLKDEKYLKKKDLPSSMTLRYEKKEEINNRNIKCNKIIPQNYITLSSTTLSSNSSSQTNIETSSEPLNINLEEYEKSLIVNETEEIKKGEIKCSSILSPIVNWKEQTFGIQIDPLNVQVVVDINRRMIEEEYNNIPFARQNLPTEEESINCFQGILNYLYYFFMCDRCLEKEKEKGV
jgi:hypothetical protein